MRYIKIHPNAKIIQPNPGDAGYDICTPEDVEIPSITDYFLYHMMGTLEKHIGRSHLMRIYDIHRQMLKYRDAFKRSYPLTPYIARIHTGLILEIPEGHVGIIQDKSGLSVGNEKKNLVGGLKVFGGVVDGAYRGEIIIGMGNLSKKTVVFKAGDKIAQILIHKIHTPELQEVNSIDELTQTERGDKGFGSTGL